MGQPWVSSAATLQPFADHRWWCIQTPSTVDIPEPCLTSLHAGPSVRGRMAVTRVTVTITADAHWKLLSRERTSILRALPLWPVYYLPSRFITEEAEVQTESVSNPESDSKVCAIAAGVTSPHFFWNAFKCHSSARLFLNILYKKQAPPSSFTPLFCFIFHHLPYNHLFTASLSVCVRTGAKKSAWDMAVL